MDTPKLTCFITALSLKCTMDDYLPSCPFLALKEKGASAKEIIDKALKYDKNTMQKLYLHHKVCLEEREHEIFPNKQVTVLI